MTAAITSSPAAARLPVRVMPVRVDRVVARRVVAIVPCFNRPADALALLGDLARVPRTWSGGAIDLRVILVDNASSTPLSGLPMPAGLRVEHVRLSSNTGGSGGFNAGLARALESIDPGDDAQHALWLVDSDARVNSETLSGLLGVLERWGDVAAAGAAIADPETGQVFEVGGVVNRRTGAYEPCVAGGVGVRELVSCDYVASCCVLVRAAAARSAGLMPDRFLNGDDVEWFIRMGQRTRSRIVAVPWAIAQHPRFDRFPTWTRYYTTRNALGAAWALGLPFRVRLRRTLRDAARAVQHTLVGRTDLAELHLAGLRDLARGAITGPASTLPKVEPATPLDMLEPALRECLHQPEPARRSLAVEMLALLGRFVLGPREALAAIPARPGIRHMARARTQLIADSSGAVLRESRGVRDVIDAGIAGLRGGVLALRAASQAGPGATEPDVQYLSGRGRALSRGTKLSLSIVVLSYNRRDALLKTLATLHEDRTIATRLGEGACTISVVDNASTDGTPDAVRARFPGVRVLALEQNLGVEAFNRGVAATAGDLILILDDDAAPAAGALDVAARAMEDHPALGAVTLLPRHPATGEAEWAFGDDPTQPPSDAWPVMGCANLIRRSAWVEAGGYEASYFLYRNDTDLALKLLSLGWGVRFDPALVAWHDSPAGPGAPKSLRWHELATRNWVWTVRRHARGIGACMGIAIGWLWAHKAAGLDFSKHAATLRGMINGLRSRPPELATPGPRGTRGRAWNAYLRLRICGPVRSPRGPQTTPRRS
jgi:GT2 family glycosyltransferase